MKSTGQTLLKSTSSLGGGGVIDFLNMCTNLYKYQIRSRWWYMYLFFHSLTVALVNAWFVFRRYHEKIKGIMPLRKFQSTCFSSLTSAGKGKKHTRGWPSTETQEILRNQQPQKKRYIGDNPDVQKDEFNHFLMHDKVRHRCQVCPRKKSFYTFIKGDGHLCLTKDRNCFLAFHK